MIHKYYLALGSNMGDREENLMCSIQEIEKIKSTLLIKKSNIYETEPVGYIEQDKFLNMVILVSSKCEPIDFLYELQKIEILLKRKREIYWGPRTIDIDILLCDDLKVDLPELIIPHPRMKERAFVLVPLGDIYEGEIDNVTIRFYIKDCFDGYGVKLFRKI